MLKYLFILFNSITVFLWGLMGGSGVKITSNFPPSIEPGKEMPVEIKINKETLDGFGRFQLDLPDGLKIKNTSQNESQFEIEGNKVRWVWTALPSSEEIVITFLLEAEAGTGGEKTITGAFSYVENNEKQQTEMSNATINVVSKNTEVAVSPAKQDSTPAVVPAPSNAEPPGEIVVERSAKKSGKDYIISIKIKKGNTKGFARYSDDAHENVQAKAIKTDGGSFSIADGKIKFVWVNVPEKDLLEVSYSLSGSPSHPILLNGEYSYLEDNQSKKVVLNTDTLNFSEPSKPSEPEREEPVVKNDPVTEKPDPSKTEKPEITLPKKNDGEVDYRVQVGAFANQAVTSATMKRKFKILETIKTEMQDGLSKFMVGSHKMYGNAGDHRNKIKEQNGVRSAFVVAYNFGKRITVQEALMISNQKWNK